MSLRNVILGYLERPASGYDIKQSISSSLSHLWEAESSQVYATLRAMEKEGLLTSIVEKSPRGPDRRVYTRTAQGESMLSQWLESAPELSRERLSVLAQIHFMCRSRNPQQTTALLLRVKEQFIQRLREYEALQNSEAKKEPDEADAIFDNLALDLGMKTLKARVEWCDEAIQRLSQLGAQGTAHA